MAYDPQAEISVRGVVKRNREDILALANVVGVGTGFKTVGEIVDEKVTVVVLVSQKLLPQALAANELVPPEIEGVETDVVHAGRIRALQPRTAKHRPAPGGVSIGHYKITAGTFGSVVRDRTDRRRLILSNNHVLANSNDAIVGDQILQPGPLDGGQLNLDTIALLDRWVPIDFAGQPGTCPLAQGTADFLSGMARATGSSHRLATVQVSPRALNRVDAAVARPVEDPDVLDDILDIGVVSGTAAAFIGKPVHKSGRTTGHTAGSVMVLDATVDVDYRGKIARFERQIVTTNMSRGGDSGSLLVDGQAIPAAVGLLFAGSDQVTIHNPIEDVLDGLTITI